MGNPFRKPAQTISDGMLSSAIHFSSALRHHASSIKVAGDQALQGAQYIAMAGTAGASAMGSLAAAAHDMNQTVATASTVSASAIHNGTNPMNQAITGASNSMNQAITGASNSVNQAITGASNSMNQAITGAAVTGAGAVDRHGASVVKGAIIINQAAVTGADAVDRHGESIKQAAKVLGQSSHLMLDRVVESFDESKNLLNETFEEAKGAVAASRVSLHKASSIGFWMWFAQLQVHSVISVSALALAGVAIWYMNKEDPALFQHLVGKGIGCLYLFLLFLSIIAILFVGYVIFQALLWINQVTPLKCLSARDHRPSTCPG